MRGRPCLDKPVPARPRLSLRCPPSAPGGYEGAFEFFKKHSFGRFRLKLKLWIVGLSWNFPKQSPATLATPPTASSNSLRQSVSGSDPGPRGLALATGRVLQPAIATVRRTRLVCTRGYSVGVPPRTIRSAYDVPSRGPLGSDEARRGLEDTRCGGGADRRLPAPNPARPPLLLSTPYKVRPPSLVPDVVPSSPSSPSASAAGWSCSTGSNAPPPLRRRPEANDRELTASSAPDEVRRWVRVGRWRGRTEAEGPASLSWSSLGMEG
ncbi:hypothetical protein ACHAWF_018873 [Thalassiosira exigua]